MSAPQVPVDPCRCPLCGQPNACAMAAAEQGAHPCWCTRATFDAALLAKIAPAAQGRACVCAACAGRAAPPAAP